VTVTVPNSLTVIVFSFFIVLMTVVVLNSLTVITSVSVSISVTVMAEGQEVTGVV
jgi:hypothetical protein